MANRNEIGTAIELYKKAIELAPMSAEAYINIGAALAEKGNNEEAVNFYLKALSINPYMEEAYVNLGNVYVSTGKLPDGIQQYKKALQINSAFLPAHNHLGLAYMRNGNITAAIRHFQVTIKSDPYHKQANNNLRLAVILFNNIKQVVREMDQGLEFDAVHANTNEIIDRLTTELKKLDIILSRYQKALSAQPGYSPEEFKLKNLDMAFRMQRKYENYLFLLDKINNLSKDHPMTLYYLAGIYARQNKIARAMALLEQSVQEGFSDWELLASDENLANLRNSQLYNPENIKG
jgi:tetratricopeptide (TPR) repeat protein